jgi:hypothetical protein
MRWLRRLAFVLLVLITLVALVHAVENFRGKRAWSRYQKDAEARGVKLDFAAYIPAPIPDDENGANTPFIQSWFPKPNGEPDPLWPTNYGAASQLLTVHRRTKGPGSQDDRFFTDMAAWRLAFANSTNALPKREKKVETHSHDVERDPKEQAKAALAVLMELQGYDAALGELRAMSSRRKVRYPINYNTEEPFSILLPHLAKMKSVENVLNLRACAELAAGQTNAAFEDVKLMLWVCDSFEEELFLISQLVRIAAQQIVTQPVWEGLARHQWTEPQLKELQERFLRADFISALDRTLAEERAGSIAAVEWVLTKRNPAEAFAMFGSDQLPANTPQGSLMGWLIPSGWFHYEKASLGIFMDEMTTGAWDLPNRQIHARVVDENNRRLTDKFKRGPVHSIWNHYMFARLLMPALEKTTVKFARAQCTAHQAALACALERFYLAEKKYPESLEALVPKFIAKIPHEVVSTNAMRYTKTANGFTLWSAGWDGKDDNGALLRSTKGEGPEQGDWVWQSTP